MPCAGKWYAGNGMACAHDSRGCCWIPFFLPSHMHSTTPCAARENVGNLLLRVHQVLSSSSRATQVRVRPASAVLPSCSVTAASFPGLPLPSCPPLPCGLRPDPASLSLSLLDPLPSPFCLFFRNNQHCEGGGSISGAALVYRRGHRIFTAVCARHAGAPPPFFFL